MAMYSKVMYWDERYLANANEPHDWYQGYKGLRHVLNPTSFAAQSTTTAAGTSSPTRGADVPCFPPRDKCRVLILGCGNSTFGEDMLRDGWTGKITNLDFSGVVIDQMKAKYNDAFYERLLQNKNGPTATVEPMDFICADVTEELQFADESFDLIVCKGSFDAVLCSAGSLANIRHLTEECVRLLTGNGVFFLVTHGNPDNRIVFLEYQNDIHYYWEGVNIHHIPRPSVQKTDYVYVCRRRINVPKRLLSGDDDPCVSKSPMGSEENDDSVVRSAKAPEVTEHVE